MAENLIPLDNFISTEAIPGDIGFFEDGLGSIFSNVFVTDLQSSTSQYRESTYYSFTLVSYTRLALEIPGTNGLALVLNPGITETNRTEFPISLTYTHEVLRYIEQFNITSFDFTPRSFYDILLSMADTTNQSMLSSLINTFYEWTLMDSHGDEEDPDPIDERSPVQKFVDDFNQRFNPATPLNVLPDSSYELVLEDLNQQLTSNGNEFDIIELIFSDYILNTDLNVTIDRIERLFNPFTKGFAIENIRHILIPRISVSIESINLALQFPRSILKPIDPETDEVIEDENIKSQLVFNAGSLNFSSENGFEFDELSSFSFSKSQVGNTGLTLEFINVKLDLSKNESIPEATAAGYAPDFVGVFIEEATIGLPPKLFKNNPDAQNPPEVAIKGRNMLIGTGGISGTIGLETSGAPFSARIGEMTVSLEAFDITFRQNAITESNIFGRLVIPGFKDADGNDAEIEIDVHIGDDGDFSITARETEGIALKIPGILTFNVTAAEVGRENDELYIAVSGLLEFEDQGGFLGKFLPSEIDIKKLIIWEDGSIEFEGGTIVLSSAITIKLGPAEIAITAIHMGTHEQNLNGVRRKYRYFGFDGGISVNPGGIDARGDGIKFYYTIDNGARHTFMRIESMAIDIVLPIGAPKDTAAVIIFGYLAMKQPEGNDPDAGQEFAGGVRITLPKPGITGSAGMRYNPKVPSFIVDVSLEFPVPIQVFPPVGIYGFRGLFGRRYVASREHIGLAADASWYLYYKKKVSPENREGIFISKFDKSKEGFSLGVGASIATSGDNGYTFSSKVFFLLSLPEIILIQGQAQILKTRLGLDNTSDPPFSAMIAISKDSVEAAFGVNYKLPDSGAILQVDALTEMAFFKKNPSAWYINVGRDLPESKRVQAKILTLFNMYSYLMLSSQGIRLGAGVRYDLKKKFGPIKLELGAYMDLMGRINFKPIQLGGGIYIGGYARLKIFKFKFELSVDAGLAVEAPKPFIISGFIKLCIRVLRKNRCVKLDFTFTFNKNIDTSEIIILDTQNMVAVNIATGETFPLNLTSARGAVPPALSQWARNFDKHVIPLDSHIDFEFNKGVGLGAGLDDIGKGAQAYENFEVIPPQKGKSPQVQHTYTIEEVKIWSLVNGTNNQWQPYQIYDALTPLQDAEFVDDAVLANLKSGWLQLDVDGKYKRLRMLSLSPLSYVNQGVDISTFTLEDLGLTEQDLFCPPATIQKTCFNYEATSLGTVVTTGIPRAAANNLVVRTIVPTTASPSPKVVNAANPFALSHGLMLNSGDQLELVFKKAMALVDLRLTTASEYVTVAYYKLEQTGETVSRQPRYSYVLIKVESFQPAALVQPIAYENADIPVSKITITAGRCTAGGGTGGGGTGGGGTGGGGTGGGGTGGGGTGGGDHDCHCDCVKCCGTAPTSPGIPASDGNEVDNLINLYNEAVRQRALIDEQITARQREISLNTVSLNRLANVPSASPVQRNDNLLQAARYRFRKNELEQEVGGLQTRLNALDSYVDQLQPLVTMVNASGSRTSAAVKALANSIFNNLEGQTLDFTCKTLFFQVCYLSLEDYLRNQSTPTSEEVVFDLSSVTDGYSKTIHPLWRPDTTYAITIKTKDQLVVPEKTSANRTYTRYFHAGFRTKGPVGHFHSFVEKYQALKAADREDEFQLATLKPYIDFAKSYPNADGRLINAKPLFYEVPKLYLFYKYAYIYNMFGNFDPYNGNAAKASSLKVLIKDPVESPDADSELIIAQTGVGFVTNSISVRQPDVNFFNNLTRGSNCVQIVPVNPIGINTEVDPGPLKPQKLYSAIFLGRYDGKDQEVHRFAFQTSRFKDFGEQINSYRLHDDNGVFLRNAVYDNTAKAFSGAQLTKAAQMLAGTLPDTDPLFSTYQDAYDLLMTGILGMPALDPAVTMEVNLVRNTSDNVIIGLLLRNPEPLNDPKITPGVLAGSVLLSMNGGPTTDHKAIFSKDNANVFISNAGLAVAPGAATFTFKYYQFNGVSYQELESVTVNLTI